VRCRAVAYKSGFFIGLLAGKAIVGKTKTAKFIPEQQKIFEHKLRYETLFDVYIILQLDVKDRQTLAARMINAATILEQQFATDLNALLAYVEEGGQEPWEVASAEDEIGTNAMGLIGSWMKDLDHRWSTARAILSLPELAALWHLPHEQFTAPEVDWLPKANVKASPPLLTNAEGVIIGDNLVDGRPIPIHLPDTSRRAHVNIVGRTEVGKSTFMHNLIHQDIKNGKGVGVIDPHGKLVRDILRASIPDNRIGDVVLIDIADENNPPPLNPLSVSGEFAAGQTIAILEQLYGEFVKVGDVLRASILTLQVEQQPTLRDVSRLFSDAEYRHRLLSEVDNPAVLDFWQEFEAQSASVQRDTAGPVLRRIRNFYGNPVLYPMICHPDSLNFGDLLAKGKIILVSLQCDERKVPTAEQRLLGTLIVSQLQMAAMSLQQIAPFQLYIDEVQQFVTTSLDVMFAEVRKYGLYLTVANQYLGQLKGPTLEAVTGNAGATIAFQLGPDDARAMAPYFRPGFEADDLANLSLHQAAVKMRLGTETLPAFSINTRPPVEEPENAADWAAQVRKTAIANYTPKSRHQLLDWLEQRYPRPGFTSTGKEGEGANGEEWLVPHQTD